MAMRKYVLTLADGQVIDVEAPDHITPDEVRADAELSFPGIKDLQPQGRSFKDEMLSLGSDAVRGFHKGIAGAVDLATLPARGMQRGISSLFANQAQGQDVSGLPEPLQKLLTQEQEDFKIFPVSEKMGQDAEQVFPVPRGDSNTRQYLRAGLEGAGGTVAGPLGTGPAQTVLNLGTGAGASMAAKTAEDAGLGTTGTIGAATAVGLLGMLAGRRLDPNEVRLARKAFSNVKPANLEVAVQRMEALRQRGTPINLSQAMTGPSNIDEVVDFLANTPVGDRTADLLKAQPSQARLQAQIQTSRLPGDLIDPQDSANLVQEAATARLKEVKDKANAAYRAEASLAPPVDPSAIENFKELVQRFKEAHPNVPMAQGLADDLLDAVEVRPAQEVAKPVGKGLVSSRMQTPAQQRPPEYLTDPGQLKEAVDSVLQGFGKNFRNTGANAADANRYAAELRRYWKETIRASNPGLERAAAASRRIYDREGNPLSKSVVGRMAGRGAVENAEAPAGRLNSLLTSGAPDDVAKLNQELFGIEPRVMRDTLKSDLTSRLGKQMPGSYERIPSDMAEKLFKGLGGGSGEKLLRAKLQALEVSGELPPGQLQDGFEKLLEYVSLAKKRPPTVSGLPSREIVDEAGRSATSSALELQTRWRVGRELRLLIQGNAYRTLDSLINTPEGVRVLQEMAQRPASHPKTQAALAAFLGESGSRPPATE